jgi:hypothetical protein
LLVVGQQPGAAFRVGQQLFAGHCHGRDPEAVARLGAAWLSGGGILASRLDG